MSAQGMGLVISNKFSKMTGSFNGTQVASSGVVQRFVFKVSFRNRSFYSETSLVEQPTFAAFQTPQFNQQKLKIQSIERKVPLEMILLLWFHNTVVLWTFTRKKRVHTHFCDRSSLILNIADILL